MRKGVRLTTGLEFADRDAPPSPVQLARDEPLARELFPLTERLEPEPWMGCQPCLPDMVPVIGKGGRLQGLWFAFGHAHHGFTLRPVTGRLLAEMMTSEKPFTEPSRYAASKLVLPAWVADMDFGVASSITAALTRLTQNQEYGYAAREGVLAEAFVRRMERRFGWHTDPADTLAVGDLVQASFSSVMAFSEPGDAVLLQLPSYPPFMRAIEDTGRRLIANPMRDDGTRWVLDLAAYEAAPDPRTRMLIFCHPQNPTGRAYSRAELEAVAAFAIRHDLVVVSDEIHADIVYPGNTHIPLASLHPEIAARTITITSATKSFNIPALRCAVMHFGSPELKGRFGRRIPSRLLGSPGVTGVDATVAAWDDGQNWLDEILAQLRANRDWLAHTIEADLPGVTMRVPEATYLAWLDCRALDLPCSAGEFFLDHARVGLNFGGTFGAEYTGFARLNFATPAPILRQIVTRMVESVRRR